MIPALLLAIQAEVRPAPVAIRTPEGAREPQLAASVGSPSVFVAFGTKSAVYVARSPDAARTFEDPVKVGDVGVLALGMRRGPRLGAVAKCVVLTAIAGEKGGGRDGDLLCFRSEDDGRSWRQAGKINPAAGSAREGLHAMGAGPGSSLFVAWIDLETDAPRILGSLTKDAGATWSKPIVLEGDGKAICPCCAPSVGFDVDGSVAVMWRNQAGEARDMVFARSNDGGASFSKPLRAGFASWKVAACPMDGGAIAPWPPTMSAVWRREDKIYKALIPGQEVLVGTGEQPWMAVSNRRTFVVWLEKRGGRLCLREDMDPPIELDTEANDPVVASSADGAGPVVAAWESGDDARPKIVVARLEKRGARR